MKKENANKDISFESALKRLEEIVAKLEGGDLSMEESLKLFEDGAALSIICNRKLEETEQKILQLSEMNHTNSDESIR